MPLYMKQMKQRRLEKMADKLSKGEGCCTTYHNTSGAYLLRRVFGCPQGGEVMKLLVGEIKKREAINIIGWNIVSNEVFRLQRRFTLKIINVMTMTFILSCYL